jgi:hypothetical protein
VYQRNREHRAWNQYVTTWRLIANSWLISDESHFLHNCLSYFYDRKFTFLLGFRVKAYMTNFLLYSGVWEKNSCPRHTTTDGSVKGTTINGIFYIMQTKRTEMSQLWQQQQPCAVTCRNFRLHFSKEWNVLCPLRYFLSHDVCFGGLPYIVSAGNATTLCKFIPFFFHSQDH